MREIDFMYIMRNMHTYELLWIIFHSNCGYRSKEITYYLNETLRHFAKEGSEERVIVEAPRTISCSRF